MAGSDHQHDEQQPTAGAGDAVRDAVERTFRDAASALQRLTGPQAPRPEGLEALAARVDALTARVQELEAQQGKGAAKATSKGGKAKSKPKSGAKRSASRS